MAGWLKSSGCVRGMPKGEYEIAGGSDEICEFECQLGAPSTERIPQP